MNWPLELRCSPAAIVSLLCLGGLILSVNLMLLGAWRGREKLMQEAQRWGKALQGPLEAQGRQDAALTELRERVARLGSESSRGPDDNASGPAAGEETD